MGSATGGDGVVGTSPEGFLGLLEVAVGKTIPEPLGADVGIVIVPLCRRCRACSGGPIPSEGVATSI